MSAVKHHGLTFVESPKPSSVKVTEVDAETKQELENAWKVLKANPGQEISVKFDTAGDAKRYLMHAKAWAGSRANRETEPLEVRKLNRKVDENHLVFTIRKLDPNAKRPGRPASHAERAAEQAKQDKAKS